ncbi:MAG TPA: DUF6069 family protein [Intrasporangium sp.]|jgi:uncharacterized protein DUF6069|uniref:DUF6069 family protein n=1 Tax=Intrasporangium sp. TaxID=1925024 RepID=UPI002F94EE70
MSSVQPSYGGAEGRPQFSARTLWAGGLASALVAALIALVGILIFRGVFNIPVLAPERDGAWGNSSTVGYMVAAAVGALLATALVHFLLISTPRALRFFSWIIGLATAAAAIAPFATGAEMSSKVATGIINLVIGIAILSLVSAVARSAVARGVTEPG